MLKFYQSLENNTPTAVKRLIPVSWRTRLGYQIKTRHLNNVNRQIDLAHPLSLPPGDTEESLREYLLSYSLEGSGGKDELKGYLEEAFRRFLYTLELVPEGSGKLLEIGANPYFMTLLLRRFRRYELTLTNYFGGGFQQAQTQTLVSNTDKIALEYTNINIERDELPIDDESFDVVLLCEVLEHFTNDPMAALLELRRVLKPGGHMIVTTPNVARLGNVARLISGNNLYDPYSAYGPYGRHNREYTRHELATLLEFLGFSIERIFTSDIHANDAFLFGDPTTLMPLVQHRAADLGQYIFVRASKNRSTPPSRKPAWLYRSYPLDELST